ncbi:hypothetical protein [Streptomyces sp. bgisy100]|uniref:hypothetical protein n=1 Tax=Streptomyces sp. bgisy100 TaxID=3413783 RepID=UPI003D765328
MFHLVCAAGIIGLTWSAPAVPLAPWISDGAAPVLGWFLIPLASSAVPIFWLRRAPHHRRKPAWQLLLPFVTGALLGFVSHGAGEDAALKERGRWAEAQVVAVENENSNKTAQCTLRTLHGQAIEPDLEETHGCENGIARGDTVRVRYDPAGMAGPEDESWKPGSHGDLIAGLATVFVGFGVWGSMRMSRQDRG